MTFMLDLQGLICSYNYDLNKNIKAFYFSIFCIFLVALPNTEKMKILVLIPFQGKAYLTVIFP